MKKALYYSIRKDFYNSVIAVTSENKYRWYGRNCRYGNLSTNGTKRDLIGKFDTETEASECRKAIADIRATYDYYIKNKEKEIEQLRRDCKLDIENYIDNYNDKVKALETL
ncbi:MAG TPA: hypothetical protein VD794_12955 [Flavisolibacter sp.]|nr:hypothetical protein [Flavisolibacter sp.]